jgi:hypothetical protein
MYVSQRSQILSAFMMIKFAKKPDVYRLCKFTFVFDAGTK